MDKREALRSMLNNLINDKHEEATLDFHNFLTVKSQEVSGLGGSVSTSGIADSDSDAEVDSDVDEE